VTIISFLEISLLFKLMDHPDPKERNCYCSLWEKSPKTLEDQGVPRGYCGMCMVCGKPGHTRHFPGAVPFTGAWCDKHYRRILLFDPRGAIGCFVWLGFISLLILSVVLFLTMK
jgi:hypothetical protein